MENWYKSGSALLKEIEDTRAEQGTLAIWFLGQCGFVLKYGEKTVLIDPVLNDIPGEDGKTCRCYPAPFEADSLFADYVFCTHGHIDHMAEVTLRGLAANNRSIQILFPAGCRRLAEQYGLSSGQLLPMTDGMHVKLAGNVSAAAFSAAHPSHVLDETSVDMALGYALSFGEIRVLHLGDTYLTGRLLDSLRRLAPPNVFLPPINGDDYFRRARNCIGNMEAEEAAKLAVLLGADLSMPMHYDMIQENTVDPLRFASELRRLAPKAKWHIPALGERILYRL